jgi:hypothetical protein
MTERGDPGKGAIMLTDHLLKTIQADRDRQIVEADRVRLLTPVETETDASRPARTSRAERFAALDRQAAGSHARRATDASA